MGTFARQNFSDQLSIETPEGVALRFPVAGIGSRGIALFLDHIFQGVVYLLVLLGVVLIASATPGSAAHDDSMRSTSGKWFIALFVLFVFCLWWGYFALFEAFWHGQTPGKRIMKLRVIKDSGRQVTLFESMARNLLRIIDYLPAAYITGIITMAVNKRNKRLGDLAAGTIVIHEARDEQPLVAGAGTFITQPVYAPADAWAHARAQDAAAAGLHFPADALAKLNSNDVLVVDTFFARALDMPMETRASMAQRVAATLCGKMGVPVPPGNPERTLEAIVQGVRTSGRR